MEEVIEEVWETIPEFPNYRISNMGRVYSDLRDHIMKSTKNNWGHMKVNLASEWDASKWTRSVALLVAQTFVENTDPLRFTGIIILDGNFENVAAHNIMWRPEWFVWKYTRQLKEEQPIHYHNLPVIDSEGLRYDSVIEAGISNGMLFHDIWMSCHDGVAYCPNILTFEIDQDKVERGMSSQKIHSI